MMIDPPPCPERELWLSVLRLGLRDATCPLSEGSERVGFRDANLARRWLGSPDFKQVCLLAGVDPSYVLRMVDRGAVWSRGEEPQTFPGDDRRPGIYREI